MPDLDVCLHLHLHITTLNFVSKPTCTYGDTKAHCGF